MRFLWMFSVLLNMPLIKHHFDSIRFDFHNNVFKYDIMDRLFLSDIDCFRHSPLYIYINVCVWEWAHHFVRSAFNFDLVHLIQQMKIYKVCVFGKQKTQHNQHKGIESNDTQKKKKTEYTWLFFSESVPLQSIFPAFFPMLATSILFHSVSMNSFSPFSPLMSVKGVSVIQLNSIFFLPHIKSSVVLEMYCFTLHALKFNSSNKIRCEI